MAVALLLAGVATFWHNASANSPVPKDISKTLDFPVYYPDQKQLPPAYTLDNTSFRLAEAGVVIYSVIYGGNQRIIFSEEQKPDSSVMDKFITSYIPLHTPLGTGLGQAQVGAYGNPPNMRTIISLPVTGGPWVIITAPANARQADLKQIIQALQK